jgi:D-3-phosphoglycerate dehydrogenase
MDKWLITDSVHPSAKLQLEAMGFEVDWQPNISNEEVLNIIQEYVGLIISTKTIINRALIDQATRLKGSGQSRRRNGSYRPKLLPRERHCLF